METSNTFDWFEVAKFISEIVLTLVAVIVSIIALWQTKKQIQLSNKQQLFERRLDRFTIIQDIMSSYSNIQSIITAEDIEIEEYKEAILLMLLHNPELSEAKSAVDDPMNLESSAVFYSKIRMLKQLSQELTIIFEKESAVLYSDFICLFREYVDCLFMEHYFDIVLTRRKEKEITESEYLDYETALSRRKKSSDIIPELQNIYFLLEDSNAENKLLEQLKL